MRALAAFLLTLAWAAARPNQANTVFHSASIRIQVLSPTVVRIEQVGPKGFEDRQTFMVQERKWGGAKTKMVKGRGGPYRIEVGNRSIVFNPATKTIAGIRVQDFAGRVLYTVPQDLPAPGFFPSPANFPAVFTVADNPRLVPPPWGATPAPEGSVFPETSGWDTTNGAPDLYLFLNQGGGYRQFVKDYLRLTGKIEMPPLYAFGLIDSRYHPYTQQQALDVIDKYRQRGFPLDMFVLDTDWRVGASKGYEVNTKLWPDLASFVKSARSRGVRTMVNDHPEPQAPTGLDSKELQYRWNGLTTLLRLGVDAWWYDRNWITHLKEPVPGLKVEIWGQRLYHDVTQKFRPEGRPLIMTNVQGIDNGVRNYAPQPGYHRYPVYWTGDTGAQWQYLRNGIANAVDAGVESLLPFVSEDLGGHWGHPSPELYVRFVQYGCLSPIARLHCTAGETRFPWDFGPEAEAVAREYAQLRYRLLPTIYSAAHRAHDDGTPLLRRCDLSWPQYTEAKDSFQYLLGDDVLVAPVYESKDGNPDPVPPGLLHTKDGRPGLTGEYFPNKKLEGTPAFTRLDPNIDFEWGPGSPDPRLGNDGFSVRWTGVVGPMPETGEYVIGTRTDDGAKLFWDGNLIVSKWVAQDGVTHVKTLQLEKGKSYDVEFDYFEDVGKASCHLLWTKPSARRDVPLRKNWIPPGTWIDAWTGKATTGPKLVTEPVPLSKTPILVRDGGIVILSGPLETTANGIWGAPMLDLYVPRSDKSTVRTMAEDDGTSVGYLKGQTATTEISMRRTGARVKLTIGAAKGRYAAMPTVRRWRLRFNLPQGAGMGAVKVDGNSLPSGCPRLAPEPRPLVPHTPFRLTEGYVLDLPVASLRKTRTIEIVLSREHGSSSR